jgi:hypothetical protein
VKNVRLTFCTFVFNKFCTLWREHLPAVEPHRGKPQEKTRRGKNTKSGGSGSDPTFSATSRPKSFWGSLPPAGTG